MKILWLAPVFNHYKARFLNHLAKEKEVALTILSGTGRADMGDQELDEDWAFHHIKVDVPKKDFGKSKLVRDKLKALFNDFDWVLIPAEKKNLPLFLYAIILRKTHKSVRLFSYNHPVLKSKQGKTTRVDRLITAFYYNSLDRVIFYTEQSYHWAIANNLIVSQKAYWANNTIDNTEIAKYYSFQYPPGGQPTLLFIGRLIPSKRVKDLIAYYQALKPKLQSLRLEIIGDGPEQHIVTEAAQKDKDILWHGTLIDEAKIAPIMSRASLVFIPGHSGLSVNHAFAYGRPYITLKGPSHAPEISYIEHAKNGYILEDDMHHSVALIGNLLKDRAKLMAYCEHAKQKGEELSIQNWVQQIKKSLLDE